MCTTQNSKNETVGLKSGTLACVGRRAAKMLVINKDLFILKYKMLH